MMVHVQVSQLSVSSRERRKEIAKCGKPWKRYLGCVEMILSEGIIYTLRPVLTLLSGRWPFSISK